MNQSFPENGRVVIRDVNTAGWHIARVPPAGGHHGWAYSVGFWRTLDHPEVAIFGLPDDVLRVLLDTIGQNIRAGAVYRDGQADAALAPPFRFVFRAVNPAWQPIAMPAGSWFYGEPSFTALQLFWPDRAHRLPWEPEFDAELLNFQPLLFEADAAAARIASLDGASSHIQG